MAWVKNAVNGLPQSFYRDGFEPLAKLAVYRRLLIGTDGLPGEGKTEFMLSCPEPGQIVCVDRMIDSCVRNPKPPRSRKSRFGVKVIKIPMDSQFGSAKQYEEYWRSFYDSYLLAINNPESRTVGVDGDGDSWDLQRLAAFGKIEKVWPTTRYYGPQAARRVMYSRAWDANKVCVFSNKVKKVYTPVLDSRGKEQIDRDGEVKKEWNGDYERQGYPDQYYLFHLQLRHFRTDNGEFGIRITMCKHNPSLTGDELTGDDCSFAGLVQYVYPEVPLKEWGL